MSYTLQDALNFHKKPLEDNIGNYPKKPADAKSIAAWLKENKIPKEESDIEVYEMSGGKGYFYIRSENVRDLTPEEIDIKTKYLEEQFKKKPQYKNNTEKKESDTKEQIKKSSNFDFSQCIGKNIICFDLETTGFSKTEDEILQINILGLTKDGEIKTKLDTFICPERKTSWDGAMEKNHITPEMVKDAPTLKEMSCIINQIFENADIIVGHNIIKFDTGFITAGTNFDFSKKILADTLQIFKDEYPEGKHSLRDALLKYCPDTLEDYDKNAHRADTDTKANILLFKKMLELHGIDLTKQPIIKENNNIEITKENKQEVQDNLDIQENNNEKLNNVVIEEQEEIESSYESQIVETEKPNIDILKDKNLKEIEDKLKQDIIYYKKKHTESLNILGKFIKEHMSTGFKDVKNNEDLSIAYSQMLKNVQLSFNTWKVLNEKYIEHKAIEYYNEILPGLKIDENFKTENQKNKELEWKTFCKEMFNVDIVDLTLDNQPLQIKQLISHMEDYEKEINILNKDIGL